MESMYNRGVEQMLPGDNLNAQAQYQDSQNVANQTGGSIDYARYPQEGESTRVEP